MRAITRMFLMLACLWCSAVAEAAAAARGTRRRDYEPYMFAAVPLHAPVPVLRVLSPAPLAVPPPARAARPLRAHRFNPSPVQRTPYTRPYAEPRPYADHENYAESRPFSDVRPYLDVRAYSDVRPYTDVRTHSGIRPYSDVRPYSDARPYSDVRTYSDARPYSDVRTYSNVRPYSDKRPYSDVRPYTELRPHSESRFHSEARPYSETASYDEPRPYSSTRPYLEAVEYYDEAATRPAPAAGGLVGWDTFALPVRGRGGGGPEEPLGSQEAAVLYARPSPSGGYTYRAFSEKKPPKKVASSKEQPVVVKIHKHKIIMS